MQVQASNPLLSSSGVLSRQRGLTTTLPASSAAAAASSSVTVTLSQAGRNLASQPANDPSLQFRALVMRDAESDPVFARKMAEEFAYNTSYELHGPLVDISHDPIRYSATGEVVTEESLAAFKAEAAKVTQGRIALYQAEKTMGTPDAQILAKLFAYVDTQSDNYLSKLNWTRTPN